MARLPRLASTLATLSICVACGGRSQATAGSAPVPNQTESPPPVGRAAPDSSAFPWLQVDTAGHTVTLALEVTSAPGSPSALINGYRAGEVQITVPLGWTVKWDWRSADSTAPHSLVVMAEREKIPLEGGRPAFSNAMTRMVTDGLRPGENDRTTFVAEEAGWYWLLCGVPGHALKGEWISLKVDRDVKLPSVAVKKKA